VLALPKLGFTKEAVVADLAAVMQQLEQRYPQSNRNLSARVTGLAADAVARVRPALLMLLGAVGFLLLIACVNVSNLLLTRTAARYREMAVRSALGAGRRRLVRQLLTENLLLAGFGGLLGVLLAGLGKGVLLALVPANLPRADDIAIDWRVLGVVALVVLGAGIGFGLVAGGQVAGGGVQGLREGTKGSTGTSRRRLRHILVVGEVALSVILLSGAALLAQSFFNLHRQETGFETRNVLTARVVLPIPANLDFSTFSRLGAGWARDTRSLLERVEHLPGVIGAGSVSTLPLSGLWESTDFAIEGEPPPEPGREPNALYAGVSDGYFAALGVPLLRGRTFDSGDRDSSAVVVISAALAKRYWPDSDPIGRRIRTFGPKPLEVIGVVGDVRQLEMGTEPAPAMYFPLSLYSSPMGVLVVRTTGDPRSLLVALRRELKTVNAGAALTDVNTMEEVLGASLAQQRFSAFLLSVFGASALGLALLGLYGVVSFGVARRSREIGIRLALGARPAAVLGTVLWEGIGLSALGIGIGVIGTLFLSRAIRGLVFGIGPSDPLTLTLVSATLVVVAVAASIGPARRAMRVDPVVALRTE
jgi:predicted permease